MRPVLSIWKKRIFYLGKLYYKFISFQIDGVILIYSLGLIGVLGFYFKETVSDLISYMPPGYMIILLRFILALSLIWGKLAGYLKLADQVFLSPLNVDGKRFLRYSHLLNKALHILVWSFIWTILYLYYRISFNSAINVYLTILICGAIVKLGILNLKFIIWNKQGRWRRRIYSSIFYALAFAFINISASRLIQNHISKIKIIVYFSFSAIILIISHLLKNDILIDWERLINEETNERVRNFAFLLGQAYEGKKASRRKTLSIFSGRKILPFNGRGALLLLYLKVLQRGKGNLTLLLQMYFSILGLILFGERLINASGIVEIQTFVIVSNIFSAYILGGFLSSLWVNLKEDVWFQIYPYSLKEKIVAIELGPTLLLLIGLLFINMALNLINGWIFNPIISLIGIVLVSIAVIKIHSYLVIARLKPNL